jgi:hypothetical protein
MNENIGETFTCLCKLICSIDQSNIGGMYYFNTDAHERDFSIMDPRVHDKYYERIKKMVADAMKSAVANNL